MIKKYIYQHDNWPNFIWDASLLSGKLGEIRFQQGQILGRLDALGFTLRRQSLVNTLADEIRHSAEIEGEKLDPAQVRSSVARRLGIEMAGMVHAGRDVEGIVEMTLDATQKYGTPLTEERLFDWHAALFPTGRSGMTKIVTGAYRALPMQIVSGPFGKERVNYRAPEAEVVPSEMRRFLEWLNGDDGTDQLLKAGIAHFWFVIIHPFDDGNGRIARAITEKLLAASDGSRDRYYSLSTRILAERGKYYSLLEKSQYSDGDITEWLTWHLNCLSKALDDSASTLDGVRLRADFWDSHRETDMNVRQQRMAQILLEGFEGKLTTSKWAKMMKCSHDTALRDIQDMIRKGILKQEEGGGRSTSYLLQSS